MEKQLLFITVIGQDRKGIVARISDYLFKNEINIEDISQKIIGTYFVMMMLVDMKASSTKAIDEVRQGLRRSERTWACRSRFSMKIFLK